MSTVSIVSWREPKGKVGTISPDMVSAVNDSLFMAATSTTVEEGERRKPEVIGKAITKACSSAQTLRME